MPSLTSGGMPLKASFGWNSVITSKLDLSRLNNFSLKQTLMSGMLEKATSESIRRLLHERDTISSNTRLIPVGAKPFGLKVCLKAALEYAVTGNFGDVYLREAPLLDNGKYVT